jgi:site-specific recombinase
MFRSLTTLGTKWRASRNPGQQLHPLLAIANAGAPFAERSEWLIELAHWIRRKGAAQSAVGDACDAHAAEHETERPKIEHTRLRYLFRVLDRNPEWKANVAGTLRATLRESDSISLLCDAGMPVHSAFFGAVFERITASLVPASPNQRDLTALVSLMFVSADDADWIETLPDDLLGQLSALLEFAVPQGERHETGALSGDLLTALHNLVCQISSTGLSKMVRSRLDGDDSRVPLEQQPFYRLTHAMLAVEATNAAVEAGRESELQLLHEVNCLRMLLDDCEAAVDRVFTHLYRNGVSVDIVFQVQRMRMRVLRAKHLLDARVTKDELRGRARLAAELVKANHESQSVSHLLRSNFALFARKLVEISADVGEHYIARDRREYLTMLRMAAGGGLVTVMTVCMKFWITGAQLHSMIEGVFVGINFAASFTLMHFLHHAGDQATGDDGADDRPRARRHGHAGRRQELR